MSPALWGSTQASVPSFTCQPERTPSRLKLCQPVKSFPLNRSFHPAAFSAPLRVLFFAPSAAGRQRVAIMTEARAIKGVRFMNWKINEPRRHDNQNAGKVWPKTSHAMDGRLEAGRSL